MGYVLLVDKLLHLHINYRSHLVKIQNSDVKYWTNWCFWKKNKCLPYGQNKKKTFFETIWKFPYLSVRKMPICSIFLQNHMILKRISFWATAANFKYFLMGEKAGKSWEHSILGILTKQNFFKALAKSVLEKKIKNFKKIAKNRFFSKTRFLL